MYNSNITHMPIFRLLFLWLSIVCLIISWERHTMAIAAQNHTWEEAFKVLGISWNPDGTLHRETLIPDVPPTPSPQGINPPPIALSTDISLDPNNPNKTSFRLYIPVHIPKHKKFPLIIFLHGGDFVLYSVSTIIFHNFCNDIASQLPAVIVSVEYRHAPEDRLPSAYYDALNAIFWARNQAAGGGRHPWMEYADFSRVFLLGSSAGANIAFHAAIQAVDFDIRPLKIRGLLMNQGYLGGMRRTPSEIRHIEDPFVPLYVNDVLWKLALPLGFNRDHEFCNPISGGTYGGRIFHLPKVYVKGDTGDPLVDRSIILAQFLHSFGVPVFYRFNEGGSHGIELRNRTAAQQLYDDFKYVINDVKVDDTTKNSVHDQPLYVDMKKVHIKG